MAGGGKIENIVSDDKYIIIYDWIHQYLKLNGNEAEAFALIYSFYEKEGFFGGSARYISERLYIDLSTAKRLLNKLEKYKYINKEKGNYKTRSKYFINTNHVYSLVPFLDKGQNATSENITLGAKCYEGRGEMPLGVGAKCHPSNKYSNKDSNNIYITNSKTKKEKEEKQKKSASNKKAYSKKDFICDIESYSDDEELRQSLIDFYDMRKAQKKNINTSGITKRLLNKLDKLSGGDIEIKKAIVDKAIESSWLSFYPLKDADIATVKNKNNNGVILTKEEKEALEKPSIPPFIKDLREKEEKGELLTDDEKNFLSEYRNL